MSNRDSKPGTVVYADFGSDRLLSKEEIGRKLGRSKRWVEERTAEGMPSTHKGRRRVYRETHVRNWLRENGISVPKGRDRDWPA